MPSRVASNSAFASSNSGPGSPGRSASDSGSGAAGVCGGGSAGGVPWSGGNSWGGGVCFSSAIDGLLAPRQGREQVAGRERDAERRQRLVADQLFGVAEHLAALVEQRLQLVVEFQPRLAGGGGTGVDRLGDAGPDGVLRLAEVLLRRVEMAGRRIGDEFAGTRVARSVHRWGLPE